MNLQDLIDRIDQKSAEGYEIALLRTSPEIVLDFDLPNVPQIEGAGRYLAINYITGPRLPGIAKFETLEEACAFVDKFDEPVDYGKVLDFADMIHRDGWADAVNAYTDDWAPDLPAESDGKPYWVEMPDFEDAELITTVGESNVYGSHGDIVPPEDKAAILVKTIFDSGESEVEMAYLLGALHIKEGSLEEYLALQLVCHNNTPYAYVRRDLMGAIWLLPVPENLEYLEMAVESEDFKRYYDEDAYIYEGPNVNERRDAIENWIGATKDEIARWSYDEEDLQEFYILFAEWNTRLKEDYV